MPVMEFDLRRTQNLGPSTFCRLLGAIVREHLAADSFGRVPFYVLNHPLNPPALRAKGQFDGFSHALADVAYRPELDRDSRWIGRGPAVIIDGNEIYARAFQGAKDCGLGADQADQLARRAILATVLHESAHVLTKPIGRGDVPVSGQAIRDGLEQQLHDYPDAPDAGTGAPIPFSGHEAPFVRAAAHLHYRAKIRGLGVPFGDIAGGPIYGLSPGQEYAVALGGELARLEAVSFDDPALLGSRPPQRFVDLWRRDVKGWWQAIPSQPTAEQEEAALAALHLFT